MGSRAEVNLPWMVSLKMETGLSYVAVYKVEAELYIVAACYLESGLSPIMHSPSVTT